MINRWPMKYALFLALMFSGSASAGQEEQPCAGRFQESPLPSADLIEKGGLLYWTELSLSQEWPERWMYTYEGVDGSELLVREKLMESKQISVLGEGLNLHDRILRLHLDDKDSATLVTRIVDGGTWSTFEDFSDGSWKVTDGACVFSSRKLKIILVDRHRGIVRAELAQDP